MDKRKLVIIGTGLLALSPYTLGLGGCIAGSILDVDALMTLGASTLLLVRVTGLLFVFHLLFEQPRMDGVTKLFWALGLLVFLTIFVVPYYWYKHFYEPYRTAKMFQDV